MEMELLSQKTISFDEPQMTGKIDRLVADAFLQAAISGDHIGIVIDEIVAERARQHTLGQRHADGGRNALAERAGRRLDAQRMTIFRMTGRRGCQAGGNAATPRSACRR